MFSSVGKINALNYSLVSVNDLLFSHRQFSVGGRILGYLFISGRTPLDCNADFCRQPATQSFTPDVGPRDSWAVKCQTIEARHLLRGREGYGVVLFHVLKIKPNGRFFGRSPTCRAFNFRANTGAFDIFSLEILLLMVPHKRRVPLF